MTKNEFYEKWLLAFAGNIPKSDIKTYVASTGNYIWHVFSWGLLDAHQYLVGDEAKDAYDNIDKRGALYIEWLKDNHTKDITWNLNTAASLDGFVEVYVVAKDFSWTYIKTHEGDYCGPYFYSKKK